MFKRTLEPICFSSDFGRQMRFITGPRQSGKTTIARQFLESKWFSKLYYNWDKRTVKEFYRSDPYFFQSALYDYPSKEKNRG